METVASYTHIDIVSRILVLPIWWLVNQGTHSIGSPMSTKQVCREIFSTTQVLTLALTRWSSSRFSAEKLPHSRPPGHRTLSQASRITRIFFIQLKYPVVRSNRGQVVQKILRKRFRICWYTSSVSVGCPDRCSNSTLLPLQLSCHVAFVHLIECNFTLCMSFFPPLKRDDFATLKITQIPVSLVIVTLMLRRIYQVHSV